MKNELLQQSIQMMRDGIQGIMKFLPEYLKENENVRGVKCSFRPHGNVGMYLGGALEVAKAIEDIEKIDSPSEPFLNRVEINDLIGFPKEGNTAEEFRRAIDAELDKIFPNYYCAANYNADNFKG